MTSERNMNQHRITGVVGIISFIYKEVDRQQGDNFSDATMLICVTKVYAIIADKKLTTSYLCETWCLCMLVLGDPYSVKLP